MNHQSHLQIQSIELRRLLEAAGSDPILRPQIDERLQAVERELAAAKRATGSLLPAEIPHPPRAAIFMRGGGVHDSTGIRPSLAGEALIQYEKMFTEQALHDEREAAKKAGRQRRPRGAITPALWFTGTPRGSFGLEFVPTPTEDGRMMEVHARSLRHVAEAISIVTENGTSPLADAVQRIPSRVLQPLKQFLKTLASYGAEIRLAFDDGPARSFSVEQVKNAAERLEREVAQDEVALRGVFRGVTRESGVFDLRTDKGEVITGTVADSLTEEDLERIDLLTNHNCSAMLQETIVTRIDGNRATSYVLLDAVAAEP